MTVTAAQEALFGATDDTRAEIAEPLIGVTGPRVVGIDLSLTSTGIGIIDNYQGRATRIRTAPKRGHERLEFLARRVLSYCKGADLVVIEGPAYAKPQGAFDMGGGWWVVTHYLWKAGIQPVSVSPSSLKKYATGKGGGPDAGKDRVLAAAVKRYPLVTIDGNDAADAFILAAMGADHLGHPVVKVPAVNRSVLATVGAWTRVA